MKPFNPGVNAEFSRLRGSLSGALTNLTSRKVLLGELMSIIKHRLYMNIAALLNHQ